MRWRHNGSCLRALCSLITEKRNINGYLMVRFCACKVSARNVNVLILNLSFLLSSLLLFLFHSLQLGPSRERRCPSCQKPTSRSTGTASPVRSSPSGATPTSPSTSTSATSHGPSRSRWGFGAGLASPLAAFISFQNVSVCQTTAPRWQPYCN